MFFLIKFPPIFASLMLPFLLARRFLSRRQPGLSGFIIRLAMLSTGLGVAVMILATSFISGFQYSIREKLFSFWGEIQVTPFSTNAVSIIPAEPIGYDSMLFKNLAREKGVKSVSVYAARPGILLAPSGELEGIQLKGVTSAYKLPAAITTLGKPINYADTAYAQDIILSRTTAKRLNVQEGDAIRLYYLEPGQTFPRVRKLTVTGTYHSGMEDIDKKFAICDLRLIQRLAGWDANAISGYQLALANTRSADATAERLQRELLVAPMYAYSITQTYEGIFGWLRMQDLNAVILLVIVSLVAVINMAATLLILMVDRTRTVGILQALGLPFSALRSAFLYLAALISIGGLIIGNVLGLGICLLQLRYGFIHLPEATYYMSTVPVKFNMPYLMLINAGTLLLTIAATLLPALYLRGIKPAKVLQFK